MWKRRYRLLLTTSPGTCLEVQYATDAKNLLSLARLEFLWKTGVFHTIFSTNRSHSYLFPTICLEFLIIRCLTSVPYCTSHVPIIAACCIARVIAIAPSCLGERAKRAKHAPIGTFYARVGCPGTRKYTYPTNIPYQKRFWI